MVLAFPNESRSFDSVRGCVRFVGHDDVFEVIFYLEIDALVKIDRLMTRTEEGYLAVFDAARDAIERVAVKAYQRDKTSIIVLTATKF